ncbi:unnamed protein product, partial [Brenthis ino]
MRYEQTLYPVDRYLPRALGSLAAAARMRQPAEHTKAYSSPRTRQPRLPGCGSHQNAPDCTAAHWLPAARTKVGECVWLSSVSAYFTVAARRINMIWE